MSKNNRKIIEKRYYGIKVKLASPLNVSSGNAINTDSDVLRNGDGECFIPGTSIAGAFKDNLNLEEGKDGIMGYTNGEEGKMSRLFISDLYFDTKTKVTARDGVKLNDEKTVENKFDMEIIETGACGIMYIECVIREGEDREQFENTIKELVVKMKDGSIRFGANKNRGFGRIDIAKEDSGKQYIYEKVFTDTDNMDFIDFLADTKDIKKYDHIECESWLDSFTVNNQYIKINVPLKLTGGISIRVYSTKPGEADYEHITCDGKPIIPGTSWNGAIRSDITRILKSLKCKGISELMAYWFGYINDNKPLGDEANARQSKIVIGESVIAGAVSMQITRNKIDRFTAGTVTGALYKEVSYFGGTTNLEILIKKDVMYKDALLEILQMVIQDIQNGYVPVGGLTAVGRGIFEANGEITCSEVVSERKTNLYKLVTAGMGAN